MSGSYRCVKHFLTSESMSAIALGFPGGGMDISSSSPLSILLSLLRWPPGPLPPPPPPPPCPPSRLVPKRSLMLLLRPAWIASCLRSSEDKSIEKKHLIICEATHAQMTVSFRIILTVLTEDKLKELQGQREGFEMSKPTQLPVSMSSSSPASASPPLLFLLLKYSLRSLSSPSSSLSLSSLSLLALRSCSTS